MQSPNSTDYKSPTLAPLVGGTLMRGLPSADDRDLQRAYKTAPKLVGTLAPAPAAPVLDEVAELTYEPEHTQAFTPRSTG